MSLIANSFKMLFVNFSMRQQSFVLKIAATLLSTALQQTVTKTAEQPDFCLCLVLTQNPTRYAGLVESKDHRKIIEKVQRKEDIRVNLSPAADTKTNRQW